MENLLNVNTSGPDNYWIK